MQKRTETGAVIQNNVLRDVQTTEGRSTSGHGSLRVIRTAVYCFAMLHILILAIAGYFIVQLHWPVAAKMCFLVAACCASVWILYQCFHQPAEPEHFSFRLTPTDANA